MKKVMNRISNIDVSCIVPVYNSEKSLKSTIKSICNQTHRNIEIICVDDNSLDNSFSILQKLCEEDPRIIILRNEQNIGAASSRNRGLKIAKGKYVIFLDSDDWFYPEMIKKTYEEAENNGADLVVFGYEHISVSKEDDEIIKIETYIPDYEIVSGNKRQFSFYQKIKDVPWNKLVKKEFIENNDILFQNIPTNNDVFYSMAVGVSAEKVVFLNSILVKYYYGLRESLTLQSRNKCRYFPYAYEELIKYIKEKKVDDSSLCNYMLKTMWMVMYGDENSEISKRATMELFYECKELQKKIAESIKKKLLFAWTKEYACQLLARKDTITNRACEYMMPQIKEICEESKKNKQKIAIWGYGRYGKELIAEMKMNNIKVDYIVDSNPNLIGKKVHNYIIREYEEIKNDVAIIICSTPKFYTEIKNRANGIEVINLLEGL